MGLWFVEQANIEIEKTLDWGQRSVKKRQGERQGDKLRPEIISIFHFPSMYYFLFNEDEGQCSFMDTVLFEIVAIDTWN
jgi:hypothetical protein